MMSEEENDVKSDKSVVFNYDVDQLDMTTDEIDWDDMNGSVFIF
jgi:hypothetical protein